MENNYLDDLLSDLKKCDLDPNDPDISEKVKNHYLDIVGEKHNIFLLFLAALSHNLPKSLRISVHVNSSSGSGKSWLIRKILKPFSDSVEEITRFTDAWFNNAADEMDEKILFWHEIDRSDEMGKGTIGNIKILLSDEGISYRKMEQSPDGWIPKNYKSSAMPVIITTSTNQLNSEDARRFFTISTDEGEEQTQNIIKHSLKKAQSPSFLKKIDGSYKHLEILGEFYEKMADNVEEIHIPFASRIESIMPKHLQMRTNVTRLIQLTKLFAFLHIMNRKCIVVSKEEGIEYHILAQLDDLRHALSIGSRIFDKDDELPSGSLKLLKIIRGEVERKIETDGLNPWPTIKECKDIMNLAQATFYSYLNPLEKYGFIEKINIPNSKEKTLKLTEEGANRALQENGDGNEINFSEEELLEWKSSEFENGKLAMFGEMDI